MAHLSYKTLYDFITWNTAASQKYTANPTSDSKCMRDHSV